MKVKSINKQKPARRAVFFRKCYQQIQIVDKVFYQNTKVYKGSRKDTNLLNINFKTIICRVLQQMCLAKEATDQEIASFSQFKSSPASFTSLVDLIYKTENPNYQINEFRNIDNLYRDTGSIASQQERDVCKVKCPNFLERLRRLFESSEIMTKIQQTSGSMMNKLLMMKYIEAIRYTIIGKGNVLKWKQIKHSLVLK